jgi:hypothetical protein
MAIDTDGVKNLPGTSANVNVGNRRSLLTDKATYLLRTGQGKLGKLIIQTVGTTWTITIYDALSAVAGKEIVQWVTADGKGPFEYQIPCATGICVVSGGTTAGAATIVWE